MSNTKEMKYINFLESKKARISESGFTIEDADLNPFLFEYQRFIVKNALRVGKYAIFADCGLGKTLMQLEWARLVSEHTARPVLILCPLAVAGQTLKEGQKFGIEAKRYNCMDVSGICVSNYDQLDNINPDDFAGVVLDESSILKNFEGKTRTAIIEAFAHTPYKLACTATPSPNDPMELGNHSEFLNVMSRNEMLAMYFVHDGADTAKWRIKGHAEKSFWTWCSTWAMMLSKPADIGFPQDERYTLPPLNFIETEIKVPGRENGKLFNDTHVSATDFNAELRITKAERLNRVAELVNGSTENFIIWIKQNEEAEYLRQKIHDAVEIKGSDSLDQKEFVSLWFGNQNNECICNTKDEKKNISLNTGKSITQKTKIHSTELTEIGSRKGVSKIQNGENQGENITKNITEKTRTNSILEHQSKQSKETNDVGSDMQMMSNIETSKNNTPVDTGSREMSGLNTICEDNTELVSKITIQCLSDRNQDAQYAEQNQPLSIQSKDFTSIIAIKPEKSEGFYAQTAIKDLESSMIRKYCSNVQFCTCCGKAKRKVLISKTKILSFGLNYQNCNNQVFASLDFSFEGLYQAIRRSYRFGQTREVNIFIVTTDTMQNVIQSIKNKENQFIKMQAAMTDAVCKNLKSEKTAKMERQYEVQKGDAWEARLGDCVQLIQDVPDESIGFSIFSPPFADLYTYSDELEDMGNSKDYNEFVYAFSFLVEHLYRVLWSGRNVAVHCMDLPIQKGKEGFIGLRDFSGMILRAFCGITESEAKLIDEIRAILDIPIETGAHDEQTYKRLKMWLEQKEMDMSNFSGFIYHSRVTIWKDPVVEMQRTKALGLLHKQIKKDAAMSRAGIPDYLLIFRKPGEHLHPVQHQDIDPAKPNYLPVDLWQKYASPVWMDIDYGDTLNAHAGRSEKDEKHICPLQLPTIERAIHLWTNEGDTVFSCFAGIGSELFQAVKMKRMALGFELKKSYFDCLVKNCKSAEDGKKQLSLLDELFA